MRTSSFIFFVAIKKKKTKKKPMGTGELAPCIQGFVFFFVCKTLLKMRDNPLSHASRFTAKLARLFN